MNKALPSQSKLRDLFDYNPDTGELFWKFRPDQSGSWNARYAGKPALQSKNKKGYLYGSLGGKTVRTHRVIWKWLTGIDADNIDHINGIRDDNREVNLRNVSILDNQKNQKKRSDNSTGRTGTRIRKDTGKVQAYICVNGQQISLGCFNTLDEANAVRTEKEIEYGFHPNHGR